MYNLGMCYAHTARALVLMNPFFLFAIGSYKGVGGIGTELLWRAYCRGSTAT